MVDFTVFKGSKGGKIIKSQSKKELSNDEVLIKVTHSGVCGTDQHYKEADMVLGHEGAGVIEARHLFPLYLSDTNNPQASRLLSKELQQRRFRRMGLPTQLLRPLQAMSHGPRNPLPRARHVRLRRSRPRLLLQLRHLESRLHLQDSLIHLPRIRSTSHVRRRYRLQRPAQLRRQAIRPHRHYRCRRIGSSGYSIRC